jgi:hypothetical protein
MWYDYLEFQYVYQSLCFCLALLFSIFQIVLPRLVLLATCITKPPEHLTGEETTLPDALAWAIFTYAINPQSSKKN